MYTCNWPVCASYDHIYVPIVMYCLRLFVVVLQTCNFVVSITLMNNACVQSFTSSKLICGSYGHIYVLILIYCLRLFVVIYKHVLLL